MEEETRVAQLKREYPDYEKMGLPSGGCVLGLCVLMHPASTPTCISTYVCAYMHVHQSLSELVHAYTNTVYVYMCTCVMLYSTYTHTHTHTHTHTNIRSAEVINLPFVHVYTYAGPSLFTKYLDEDLLQRHHLLRPSAYLPETSQHYEGPKGMYVHGYVRMYTQAW